MQTKRKHSDDFKRKIVELRLAGASPTELSKKYNVRTNIIHRWVGDARYSTSKPRTKTIAARTARRSKGNDDIKRIVAELMQGWEETLEGALRALVDLAVKRKLDSIDGVLRAALKGAS